MFVHLSFIRASLPVVPFIIVEVLYPPVVGFRFGSGFFSLYKMFKLSIVTLNVNGIRDKVKLRNVLNWVKLFCFDVIMLQETFLMTHDFDYIRYFWGGEAFFSPSASTHSCGTAILFSPKLNCKFSRIVHDDGGRFVSVLCEFNNTGFIRFCSIYAPCNPRSRIKFFQDLSTLCYNRVPLVLGGDFNCISTDLDRSGSTPYSNCFAGSVELRRFIDSYGLVDSWSRVNPTVPGHTWLHPGRQLSSRLDRVFVPKEFSIASCEVLNCPLSDHDAVKTCVNLPPTLCSLRKGKGFWKFNCSLLDDSQFKEDLRHYYMLWRTLKPGFKSVGRWWDNIKQKVKGLSIKHGIRRAREKRARLFDLQSRCLATDYDGVTDILAEEGRGAMVRSRELVLEEGEQPSSYFYRKERAQGESKVIRSIRNNEGRVVEGDSVVGVFTDFYSTLYSKEVNTDCAIQDVFLECIQNKLSCSDRATLEGPFSLGEIKSAIHSMGCNKSPGVDGVSVEFYRDYFDLLGTDLLEVYNEVFDFGELTASQRTGVITLLPKKGDLQDPSSWRPISLLTIDYKIIAKVLQARLSRVIHTVVNGFQVCGVPGRSIHHNLAIIRDIVDFSRLRNGPCAILSLDQQKAFDRVDWDFLFRVLERMNFGPVFMKWIRILYYNISSKILINGDLSPVVDISRGVRQGCPLSPALYVLFLEPLSQFILKDQSIAGFSLPGGWAKSIKVLQYADDITCVATSVRDIKGYFKVINLFERATGACINMNKTVGLKLGSFVSCHLPGNHVWSISSIKVTGVTFGNPQAILCNWSIKVAKMKSLLGMWNRRNLTILGKVKVLNTVIFPMFYYLGPVFPVPNGIVREVLSLSFKFLWSGKTELIARNVVMLDRADGGLGLDNFKAQLLSLFVRPLFNMLRAPVDRCEFYLPRYFMSSKLRAIFPHLWSNLLPNSSICSPSLSVACCVISTLHVCDSDFLDNCRVLRDIVYHLRPKGVIPLITIRKPHLSWHIIWQNVFDKVLENKYVAFQWKLSHSVLYTGEILKKWGIGRGRCSLCNANVETDVHLLWDCPKIYAVLSWVSNIVRSLGGSRVYFSSNLFIYGICNIQLAKATFQRLWYVFCVSKFFIWKARCTFVHEKKYPSEEKLIRSIICDIKIRIRADYNRLEWSKFEKLWVVGKSFVCIVNNKVVFNDLLSF